MKQTFILLCLVVQSVVSVGQEQKPDFSKKVIKSVSDFGKIGALRDIEAKPVTRRKKHRIIPNNLRRYKYTNIDALPLKKDAVLQSKQLKTPSLSPLKSWDGIDHTSQQATPPDPSGAAGINHYVQMVNVAMQVFDKSGNSLWGPTSLSSVFPGSSDDGDPIVMYDKYADRWFISQFQTAGNKILIAVSQTSDPLGSWYYYTYSFSEFPDYPKYSIWNNGYYMSSNSSSENIVCFERDKMLAGDGSARMVALTVPDVETNGFFSAMPAHADGDKLPKAGTPQYLFYYQDDGWAAGNDRINVWEMLVDWNDPTLSNISLTQEIDVTPFNTDFDENWNDLIQPGTTQRLDAVPGCFMYMGQYKDFKNHNSLVLSHTVDVDLTTEKRAAVRWYELRQNKSSTWELHQEGTFGLSDGASRWMGCVAMDRRGNIGMAYAKTSATVYPGIKFTGRKSTDALGIMTINESNAFTGTGSQTGTNRFGDYGHMMLDPVDGLTFWYTGEYMDAAGWKTGVFSFKIGDDFNNDVSVLDIINPTDGVLTSTEKVKVVIKNLGQLAATGFTITINVNGTINSETYPGTINAGDSVHYELTGIYDFSTLGFNTVSVYSGLIGDEDLNNDTACTKVFNKYQFDVGVPEIISPKSGVGLGVEKVQVYVENLGTSSASGFPINYTLNGVLVSETYTNSINPGDKLVYEFNQKADVSVVGVYSIVAFTALTTDQFLMHDTSKASIETKNCSPTSDCTYGDEILLFKLHGINNSSGCVENGYSDYTNLVGTVPVTETQTITVHSGTDEYLTVWIDLNDNFVFEPSEEVVTNVAFNNTVNATFTLPLGVNRGIHLLRARVNWSSNSNDPCSRYDYGETEDYKVEVVDPSSISAVSSIDFNITYQTDNIKILGQSKLERALKVEIINSLGQLMAIDEIDLTNTSFEHLVNTANYSKGIYYVRVSSGQNQVSNQFLVK
jgi:hypothetical protein